MRCRFCNSHVNEKRVTTYHAHVASKNGALRKVRWCKPCDETKADEIDRYLRKHDDIQASSDKG